MLLLPSTTPHFIPSLTSPSLLTPSIRLFHSHLNPSLTEEHSGSQTHQMLISIVVNIRQHSVFSGRNLIRNLHILDHRNLALLNRASQVNIADLFAQIRFRVD